VHPYESFDYVAKRIAAAGYGALCVTVDSPMTGFRVRNKTNRFHPDRRVWSGSVPARMCWWRWRLEPTRW
jgi:isopentenyl diphosphate isomerase/L-lactate dehydrogenase-like FMN-dependent dehydrogenase